MNSDEKNKCTFLSVKIGHKNLIWCFHHYIIYCNNESQPIGENWTRSIKNSDFDLFYIKPNYLVTITQSTSTTVHTPSSPSSQPRCSYSSADLFCHGIKQDSSLSSILKVSSSTIFNDITVFPDRVRNKSTLF